MDFLTDSYSLENGGFRKWRGFGWTKNPPFSRFYCNYYSIINFKCKNYQKILLGRGCIALKNPAFTLLWAYSISD